MQKPLAASSHAKSQRSSGAAEVGGISITHPDKVFWAAGSGRRAITKRDLAVYLAAVAPRILPHIVGRPLSMVRAPDGIDGERFFQRHPMKGAAAPMLSMRVGGTMFAGISNARALVALAQAGVLEIHPWGSAPSAPNVPERLIFDLDPGPGVPFSEVVAAAKNVAARLRKLGLVPFVKTTGGKGLHVVVPIRGERGNSASWLEARQFAKALCQEIAKEEPARFTASPKLAVRKGKVFLDYLRNARSATAVAPWSPRARPGAPVAMPLPWSALRAGLDPGRYNLANSRSVLAADDPWEGLGRTARSLGRAMKKLAARQS